MTDREIINVLTYCNTAKTEHHCVICPFYEYKKCTVSMLDSAVDLINRQKAEIEQWKEEANKYQNWWASSCEESKSEIIKDFAERLKEHFINNEYNAKTERKTVRIDELKEQIDWILHEVSIKIIDNLVKEMTEREFEK